MRPAAMCALALCAVGAGACGAADRDPNDTKSEVEVVGCLTGSNDRFILTELDRAETGTTIASPATESYQLIGDAGTLRQHVGKQVRVAGMAELAEVAVVRESSPAAPAQPGVGTAGNQAAQASRDSNAGQQPKVSTEQQTRLEVSSLRVRSVTVTGDSCRP